MPLTIKDEFQLQGIFHQNGRDPLSREKVTLNDVLATTNAPLLFPKVIQNIVKEAAEPWLIGTSLLTRINYSYGQTITFPAVGAMYAADIAEMQEYPEGQLQMGGGTVTASVGKSGLAVTVTDEMIRYSQFDVISWHLREAGKALARLKEVKIFNYIRAMGTTVFDNIGTSLKGICTGRSIDGQPNGSCTMDDIFDTYAQLLHQGYMPNTILLHPLAWAMWLKDAQLRAFALMSGGGSFFSTWTGNPNQRAPWDGSSQGGLGVASGQNIIPGQTDGGYSGAAAAAAHGLQASALLDYPQTMNSAPVMPNYLGIPFRILVSPYVYCDPARKLTDIYMFDAGSLGVLIVDEDITTDEWTDPRIDVKKIKIRERYGIGLLHEGQQIAKLANVHMVPNEIAMPVLPSIDVSGSLGPIAPDTNLNL